MIETWIITFLYAWKQKLNIKLIFKDCPIYFPLAMLLVYIIAEIMIFNDNYWIVQYGTYIKQVTLFSYIGLIIKYQLIDSQNKNKSELVRFLTSPFVVGVIFLVMGYLMNYAAIVSNGGHMPVYPSNSYFTGYTDIKSFTENSFYVLGNYTIKVIPLCDIYDLGYTVMSLGDIFVRAYVFIILYFSIKRINKNKK